MKIKKYELEPFITYLHSLKLDRADSRLRTRFKKILLDKYQQFTEELEEINQNYAIKNEQGEVVVQDNKLTFENNDERLKEIHDLSIEVIIIEQNEENKKMLLSVKESVLYRGPEKFEEKDADIYDCLAEIVEQINYEN
ncbi:hypothetical protein SAMN04487895_101758 [Paenibacillus sophorae]|uniref:Uncharacterized protein n=1 Tax=Paenibacillus sophorae TaxID=1333845 RepID=A0A1H8H4N5_9BACL|nr:hypothetical protein [Paenibacillus sophorae]QWU14446.1 hypothetical protein KP014_21295 [Paenibacillus sophorae]SEN51312.1 hypothetical protein SAMN04487895_101758 [Paenibacillus sophorae]